MIQKIYQNVFGSGTEPFDPEKNIYVVLVNFTGKSILDTISSYVKEDGFDEIVFNLSDIEKPNYIGNSLYQNHSSRYISYLDKRTHYIVLFEYDEIDISTQIGNVLQQIKECNFLNIQDRIVLLATLPDVKEKSVVFLKHLEKEQSLSNIIGYFFVREMYKEIALHSALGGVLCLYGDKALYNNFERNFADAELFIDAGERGLPEAGQLSLCQRPKLYWSTLNVYDQSDKMSFLSQYLYGLYDNCLKYENISCSDICASFFQKILNISNKRIWIKRLERAVQCIPRIIQTEPDQHQSIESYCTQLYGSDGMNIFELTLQINLQKRFIFSKQVICDAAKTLLEHAGKYYTRKLKDDVINHIDDYIRKDLQVNINTVRESVYNFARNDADINLDLPVFIDRYISYCDLLQQCVFWAEVKNFILLHSDSLIGKNEEANFLADKLDQMKRDLHVLSKKTGESTYPQYEPYRLLSIETDSEICQTIKNAYENNNLSGSQMIRSIPSEGVYSDLFPCLPLFYREYRYGPLYNNNDNVVIFQRIGRYYMFGE